MTEAIALLHQYLQNGDEEAFRQIVARYFNFVHGIAARRLSQIPSHAIDVVQIVFADLARNGHKLHEDSNLGGWLHRHTCFVASKFLRSEARRVSHEQNALKMQTFDQSTDDLWSAIAPLVDDSLQYLADDDRFAILLRYFEGRDLRSVGAALRISEDAAQKRVQRALERLKSLLAENGVAVSAIALASLLTANASPAVASPPIHRISTSATNPPAPAAANLVSPKFTVALVIALVGILLVVQQNRHPKSESSTTTVPAPAQPAEQSNSQGPTFQPLTVSKSPNEAASNQQTLVDNSAADMLTIQVTDAKTKKPIAGAKVRISNGTPPQPSTEFVDGDTLIVADEKGMAQVPLTDSSRDRLMLQTYADDHADWVSIWNRSTGDVVPHKYDVALEPGVPLGGRVLDQDGIPIEGAAVRFGIMFNGSMLRSSQQMQVRPLTNITDAAGAWLDTHIPESSIGRVSLSIFHAEFAKTNLVLDSEALSQLRARTFTVILNKGVNIAGRVTTQNGEPIANALVAYGRRNFVYRIETKTDVEGRYILKNITPQAVHRENIVSVIVESYAAATQPLPPNPTPDELNFTLEPGGIIRGRVVNSDGEPLSNIRVIREAPSRDAADGIEWYVITKDDGRFYWNGSPNSPQKFYFGAPGYVEIRDRVLTPKDEDYVITMQKPGKIKGIVKDSSTGRPIPLFFATRVQGAPDRITRSDTTETEYTNGTFEFSTGENVSWGHNVTCNI